MKFKAIYIYHNKIMEKLLTKHIRKLLKVLFRALLIDIRILILIYINNGLPKTHSQFIIE